MFLRYTFVIIDQHSYTNNVLGIKIACRVQVFPPRTHIHCTQEILRITGNLGEYVKKVNRLEELQIKCNCNCKINVLFQHSLGNKIHRKFVFLSHHTHEGKRGFCYVTNQDALFKFIYEPYV